MWPVSPQNLAHMQRPNTCVSSKGKGKGLGLSHYHYQQLGW